MAPSLLPLPVTTPSSSTSSSSFLPTYPPPPPPSISPRIITSKLSSKGKFKARDDYDEEMELGGASDREEEERRERGMGLSVRFTDGGEDLMDLWVGGRESVREVKRRIRIIRPTLVVENRPRRLRLILLGRLLTDGTYLVPYTLQLLSRRAKLVKQQTQGSGEALIEGLGLEVVVGGATRGLIGERPVGDLGVDRKGKGKEKEKERETLEEEEEDTRVWLHCSVGEPMEEEELSEDKVQTTQITPLQGFDKLRDAGFSETEIHEMREEFRSTNRNRVNEGDDEDEHARALEDQWMEGLTANGTSNDTIDSSSSGVYTTLLQGVCVSFFFPFLPLFFFRTQIFSKRMQMAIVLGICFNLSFGLVRWFS